MSNAASTRPSPSTSRRRARSIPSSPSSFGDVDANDDGGCFSTRTPSRASGRSVNYSRRLPPALLVPERSRNDAGRRPTSFGTWTFPASSTTTNSARTELVPPVPAIPSTFRGPPTPSAGAARQRGATHQPSPSTERLAFLQQKQEALLHSPSGPMLKGFEQWNLEREILDAQAHFGSRPIPILPFALVAASPQASADAPTVTPPPARRALKSSATRTSKPYTVRPQSSSSALHTRKRFQPFDHPSIVSSRPSSYASTSSISLASSRRRKAAHPLEAFHWPAPPGRPSPQRRMRVRTVSGVLARLTKGKGNRKACSDELAPTTVSAGTVHPSATRSPTHLGHKLLSGRSRKGSSAFKATKKMSSLSLRPHPDRLFCASGRSILSPSSLAAPARGRSTQAGPPRLAATASRADLLDTSAAVGKETSVSAPYWTSRGQEDWESAEVGFVL